MSYNAAKYGSNCGHMHKKIEDAVKCSRQNGFQFIEKFINESYSQMVDHFIPAYGIRRRGK